MARAAARQREMAARAAAIDVWRSCGNSKRVRYHMQQDRQEPGVDLDHYYLRAGTRIASNAT
jgi:hypothetical protein